MHTKILAAAVGLMLVLTAPSALAAAYPAHHHSGDGHRLEAHDHPQIDWSATTSDVQALKAQLDQLRAEQKGLYEQMRQQRDRIKSAHQGLTDQKRHTVNGKTKELMTQLYGSSKSIHVLREKSHSAWDEFYKHSQAKEWTAAKKDMETILAIKREVVTKQKHVVLVQQRLVELMKK